MTTAQVQTNSPIICESGWAAASDVSVVAGGTVSASPVVERDVNGQWSAVVLGSTLSPGDPLCQQAPPEIKPVLCS